MGATVNNVGQVTWHIVLVAQFSAGAKTEHFSDNRIFRWYYPQQGGLGGLARQLSNISVLRLGFACGSSGVYTGSRLDKAAFGAFYLPCPLSNVL